MIHYKIRGTDGVSLEIDKWKRVLESGGHSVFLLGGEVGDNGEVIHPELHHMSDTAKKLYRYTFQSTDVFKDDEEYLRVLYQEAGKAQHILEQFISENSLTYLIYENIWSVAMNPAVAIAAEWTAAAAHIPVLAQHHDFYWERIGGFKDTGKTAGKIIDQYLPPKNPDYTHVVINTLAHKQLQKRKGLKSHIIPNVFDFTAQPWSIDGFNQDLKKAAGLSEKDIMILQATRIVDRKGIEAAIDLTAALNSKRSKLNNQKLWDRRIFEPGNIISLVLAGYASDDGSGTYVKRLTEHAARKGVDIRFIGNMIGHTRSTEDARKKRYSLWDSYIFADLITYPSYWEGWGNQLLEGVFSGTPMAVFEYPIFLSDIKSRGFNYISLGKSYKINAETQLIELPDQVIEKAANECITYLLDAQRRAEAVEQNMQTALKYYSIRSLEKYLLPLI